MNQLINDKGVCRTAPATPGLLKRGEEHKGEKKEEETGGEVEGGGREGREKREY